MAENSKIEWTHHTINLWWGCTKVHPGCDNCYAEVLAKRFKNNIWGNNNPRKEIKSVWNDLNKYQKIAKQKNEIHRVFVGSMMDVFEKPMPLIDANIPEYTTGVLRNRLFEFIELGYYPNLLFLFLTKRPSNINKYIPASWKENPPTNVMFGTSPANQKTFNDLTNQLLKVKGKKFLSIEPQLDAITIETLGFRCGGINWIIQGGESGAYKRPFKLEWALSLQSECKKLSIPYFFKQVDKIQQIPENMLIREFPY